MADLTFSWAGARVQRAWACHWHQGPVSCAGPQSSPRRLPSCGRAYGTGAAPRLLRGPLARTVFRKSAGVSFHEKCPHAASFSSKRGGPDRHCCRAQKPAIDVPLSRGAAHSRRQSDLKVRAAREKTPKRLRERERQLVFLRGALECFGWVLDSINYLIVFLDWH